MLFLYSLLLLIRSQWPGWAPPPHSPSFPRTNEFPAAALLPANTLRARERSLLSALQSKPASQTGWTGWDGPGKLAPRVLAGQAPRACLASSEAKFHILICNMLNSKFKQTNVAQYVELQHSSFEIYMRFLNFKISRILFSNSKINIPLYLDTSYLV